MQAPRLTWRAGGRRIAPAALFLVLFAMPPSASATTFTVDSNQAASFGGTCASTTVVDCTLVDAINQANLAADADTIAFNVPASPATIDYRGTATVLPTINFPVTIDGTTQPGYSSVTGPKVEVRGAGFSIQAASSAIKALAINSAPGDGVVIAGSTNTLTGDFIGTDRTGLSASPNGGSGVRVQSGNGNTIGATGSGRNVISGNGTIDVGGASAGIQVDAPATSTAIVNNEVGVEFNGAGASFRALPNEGNGINVAGTGTTVGGTSLPAGNVISGNTGAGLLLTGAGNTVTANLVGTDGSGEFAVPNGTGIASFASNNTIGGNTAGMKNVVSGNAGDGIAIGITTGTPAPVAGNVVKGNRVGTDDDGVEPVPNLGDGVYLHSTQGNTIGGAATGEANVISANRARGVAIDGTPALPSQSNSILGNRIGTDVNGVAALGNKLDGVNVAANVNGPTTVGGTGTGAPNTIAFNGSAGVRLPATGSGNTDSTGVAIRGNSIFSNNGLGIDLDNNGVTPNDPGIFDADTGPNGKQNFPLLQSATSGGGSTTVHTVLLSNPSETYTVDFYSDTSCDPAHNGEGRTFLGSETFTTLSGDGSWVFDKTLPEVPPGQVISATATDSNGSTSEFSACRAVDGPPAVSVSDVNVAESGGEALVVVTLDHPSARPVSVDVATHDGSAAAPDDYAAQTTTFTFQPGQMGLGLHIPIQQDALDEADETFTAAISNPHDATIADASGTVTIGDDDASPSLSIADTSVTEGTGGSPTQMTFTASLSAASGRAVTVDATTADGTAKAPGDYDATSSSLTFPAGTTTRTFTVPVAPDSADESDETLTASLSAESGATVTSRTATGTIADDDEPEKKPDPEVQIQTVVVPGQTEPRDTKAPALTIGRLPTTVKRKDFLAKGLSFDLTPDEAASFEVALIGKTKTVTLARAGDTTLADADLAIAPGKRTVKLKLPAKLKRAFTKKAVKLELRIAAYDAAGNRTKVTKTLTVR